MTEGALRVAQTGIEDGRYFGSGLMVRHTAEAAGAEVRVLSGDASDARRERLRASGLSMLDEAFPWRMTCLPVQSSSLRGESKYYGEVLLAGRPLTEGKTAGNANLLWWRLRVFAQRLAVVLRLPAECLTPHIIGH